MPQDLPATAGEFRKQLPAVSGDLVARHMAYAGGPESEAHATQPERERVVVDGSQQVRPPEDRVQIQFAPPALGVPADVEQHHVRVQLRVQRATRQVAKHGRDHAVRNDTFPTPGGTGVPHHLHQAGLDERGRLVGRFFMRAPHRPVPAHLGLDRYGFRWGEGDVDRHTVLALARPSAQKAHVGTRNAASQQRPERLRCHAAGQTQRRRTRAGPPTRAPMRAARIAAVPRVVRQARRGACQSDDTGDHCRILASAGSGRKCRPSRRLRLPGVCLRLVQRRLPGPTEPAWVQGGSRVPTGLGHQSGTGSRAGTLVYAGPAIRPVPSPCVSRQPRGRVNPIAGPRQMCEHALHVRASWPSIPPARRSPRRRATPRVATPDGCSPAARSGPSRLAA